MRSIAPLDRVCSFAYHTHDVLKYLTYGFELSGSQFNLSADTRQTIHANMLRVFKAWIGDSIHLAITYPFRGKCLSPVLVRRCAMRGGASPSNPHSHSTSLHLPPPWTARLVPYFTAARP